MAGKWRGKGNQAMKQQTAQPQVLELQFHERANSLFELLMNWNTQPQQLENAWKGLIDLRTRAMQAYGGGKVAGAPTLSDGAPAWKSEFYSAYARKHKEGLKKDDISFDVTEVPNPKGGACLYVAILTCINMASTYEGKPAKSKKDAEHEAAKAAIQAEFKADFARLNSNTPAPVHSLKRKADALSLTAPNQGEAKQRLLQASQLLTGTCNKGDLAYEVTEAGPGKYTATVTLNAKDPSTAYKGVPCDSKKGAESAAAEAALAALKKPIAAAEEAHKAKKKKASQEKLKEFTDKKKAAKEAAGAAKPEGLN